MQFYLIQESNFTYTEVETMPIYELKWFYNRLIEYFEEKVRQIKEAKNK